MAHPAVAPMSSGTAARPKMPISRRDERTIDDHGRSPRPEVPRVKTAPGEQPRAEDLEELVVYRVESCLRILSSTALHLDIGGGLFHEPDR